MKSFARGGGGGGGSVRWGRKNRSKCTEPNGRLSSPPLHCTGAGFAVVASARPRPHLPGRVDRRRPAGGVGGDIARLGHRRRRRFGRHQDTTDVVTTQRCPALGRRRRGGRCRRTRRWWRCRRRRRRRSRRRRRRSRRRRCCCGCRRCGWRWGAMLGFTRLVCLLDRLVQWKSMTKRLVQ